MKYLNAKHRSRRAYNLLVSIPLRLKIATLSRHLAMASSTSNTAAYCALTCELASLPLSPSSESSSS